MEKSFRASLMQVVLRAVAGISLFAILFVTFQYVVAHVKNEYRMAKKQTEMISNTIEQELASLYQLGNMMKDDKTIQSYMEELPQDGKFLNDVSMELVDYKKLNPNISTVLLARYADEDVLYAGSAWKPDSSGIFQKAEQYFSISADTKDEYTRITMGQSIFDEEKRMIHLFFPVFHSYWVYQQTGFICVSVSEEVVQEYYAGDLFDNILIADEKNVIVSHQNSALEGMQYENGQSAKEEGEAYHQGIYSFTSEIRSCGWYVAAEISLYRILKGAAGVLAVSMLILCVMCIGVSVIYYKKAQKLIHPVEDLKERMGAVAAGDMTTRMDVRYRETEFNEMADSFNRMVKNVDQLMERIRQEQIQMQKIQLGALQEQIKPHFLYNTLECIRMQAVIDGNDEIARFVLALASYYRLCLGKGQDVVTLKQELAHIDNYLIIQNGRYGNIICLKKDIPETFYSLHMLKMTLQPLVENCIYHGIKVREGQKGEICISAYRQGDAAVISVSDDGVGMNREQIAELNEAIQTFDEKKGYGVRNVNRRIRIFFGEQYGLTYFPNGEKGVRVEIRVPYEV